MVFNSANRLASFDLCPGKLIVETFIFILLTSKFIMHICIYVIKKQQNHELQLSSLRVCATKQRKGTHNYNNRDKNISENTLR